jgi:tetraacyldisaccharide 4'-kinase
MFTPETFRAIVSGDRRGLTAAGARIVLSLGELGYRAAIRLRNRRYDEGRAEVYRVEVPVISVGNLTLGGTGKTPMVAWLARWFRARQVRVSLISRGYGARTARGNDELKELAERLPDVPHLQDPDRRAAARVAIDELETQLIILDDGFQHRRIGRDLDIVLVDATEPFGYERVFPRGMLREPITSLRRADVVALTRCNLVSATARAALQQRLQTIAPQAILVDVEQRPQALLTASGLERPLDQLPHGPVLAFCGIGNPGAFRRTLEQLGWPLENLRVFPDHHPYDPATMTELARWVADHPRAGSAVCTHKDLVKIGVDRLGALPLFALTLELQVGAGRASLEAKLQRLLPQVASPS